MSADHDTGVIADERPAAARPLYQHEEYSERLHIEGQFDTATNTISYIVLDQSTGQCALIDTVLDYTASSAHVAHKAADRLVARVKELGASVDWVLETHLHADHLSSAPYVREALGGRLGIGARVTTVQKTFAGLFNPGPDFRTDGSQFDRLFEDGDAFTIGALKVVALHTPGHTPACMSYLVCDGDPGEPDTRRAAFVGDTLFMPDYGTARCDFPGGDARQLFRSIGRLLALPPDTKLYTCHDYQPGGRAPRFDATVAEQRSSNIHVHEGITEDEFAAMREARDASLPIPALILPSVQVNMRAGQFPEPEDNGRRYLKIPLDAF